ncbi:hypothetical protein BKH41_01820 [Helicobacter sp. 12S02232-10]|uniref:hypothetical protein n=1 Tax=Helicobacter sp. 12S02232-10 TaxID=1476197 RepID=UPI000BA7B39C|nr:hypothetical protein [Helicobacter sp. 12S02232-10]PAF49430.1 hypothetical protein BKH41_01820 [Helicobacter sp. 12S02232-10]
MAKIDTNILNKNFDFTHEESIEVACLLLSYLHAYNFNDKNSKDFITSNVAKMFETFFAKQTDATFDILKNKFDAIRKSHSKTMEEMASNPIKMRAMLFSTKDLQKPVGWSKAEEKNPNIIKVDIGKKIADFAHHQAQEGAMILLAYVQTAEMYKGLSVKRFFKEFFSVYQSFLKEKNPTKEFAREFQKIGAKRETKETELQDQAV